MYVNYHGRNNQLGYKIWPSYPSATKKKEEEKRRLSYSYYEGNYRMSSSAWVQNICDEWENDQIDVQI
jgi:hypothetical protein